MIINISALFGVVLKKTPETKIPTHKHTNVANFLFLTGILLVILPTYIQMVSTINYNLCNHTQKCVNHLKTHKSSYFTKQLLSWLAKIEFKIPGFLQGCFFKDNQHGINSGVITYQQTVKTEVGLLENSHQSFSLKIVPFSEFMGQNHHCTNNSECYYPWDTVPAKMYKA